MNNRDWTESFGSSIVVCDAHGIILSMNRAAGETFQKYGGRELVGKSLLDCHQEPARGMLSDMLKNPRSNTYTIEKGSLRKLIHQSPWYQDGKFAGYVELSIVLPGKMPHHVRRP